MDAVVPGITRIERPNMSSHEFAGIQVDRPCSLTLEELQPEDEKGRFSHCESCQSRVYNLSRMTPRELRRLGGKGGFCASVERRADGSLVLAEGRGSRLLGAVKKVAVVAFMPLLVACGVKTTEQPADFPETVRVEDAEDAPDPNAAAKPEEGGPQELTKEQMETLRTLGYVDF